VETVQKFALHPTRSTFLPIFAYGMTCFGSTLLNRKHAARYSNLFTTFPKKKWRNFPGALTKFASLAVFDGSALHPAGIFFGRSAISPRKLMLKKSSHL